MILLDEVKLVLFDFDDTLCIHKKHHWEDGYAKSYLNAMVSGDYTWWEGCDYSKHMAAFMMACASRNIDMGLVSATSFHATSEAKIKWVEEKYGVSLKNYSVGTSKDKVTIVDTLSNVLKLRAREILVIDDRYDVLDDIAAIGCQAASPMEVVNWVEAR